MTKGHGEKLSRRREAAIAGLIAEGSIEKAAAAAGIGTETLRRWIKLPEFAAGYRDARAAVLERAVGHLHGLLDKATSALDRGLDCGKAPVELRAAQLVIENTVRGAELLDLAERVRALEEAAAEPDEGGSSHGESALLIHSIGEPDAGGSP